MPVVEIAQIGERGLRLLLCLGVDVGEDTLREGAHARESLERSRGLSDGARVGAGRRQPSHEPWSGRRSVEPLAHQVPLPARRLDEPLEGGADLGRALERERDQLNRAADRLDRDVPTGLRAAQLLHRGDNLTMTQGRGRELALGLGA